jgi:hypothetical protein
MPPPTSGPQLNASGNSNDGEFYSKYLPEFNSKYLREIDKLPAGIIE